MKKILMLLAFVLFTVTICAQKEYVIVQEDGSLKMGYESILSVDDLTGIGFAKNLVTGKVTPIMKEPVAKSGPDVVIAPKYINLETGNSIVFQPLCGCSCCGNRFCPRPKFQQCYTCPQCGGQVNNPYFYLTCSCGSCILIIIEE